MKGFAKKFSLLLFVCFALCYTCLAAGTGESASNANSFNKSTSNKLIRIALCHLDVAQGPQEKNIQKIEKAIHIAGRHGANWIVTPETALQGYYFYVIDPKQKDKIEEQPSDAIRSLPDAGSRYGAYLFLGAGEYDKQADCYRNSCLIFGPDGKLTGRHSKMSATTYFIF
ncbi:MAG: carbon-nitrogen hydrolase family protein, partial [Acidaminococcaceae bacterium]|nr:carbon-nitrogen hydrolase family protein [Acidaminococcaceae bacterium]